MIVRPIQEKDLAACIHMGARMHRASDYAALEYSPERCLGLGRQAIDDPAHVWLVALLGDDIVGMMGGYCGSAYFSDDQVANDYLVYVTPEQRGGRAFLMLVKAFVSWATEQGAKQIRLGNSAMIADVGRLYERLGFDRVGGIYRRNT